MNDGSTLIAIERRRQVESEKWSALHDDFHDRDELARAAACYAMPARFRRTRRNGLWGFEGGWWKPTPKDRIRELVKAGALIAAEIDRLQRALPPTAGQGEGK